MSADPKGLDLEAIAARCEAASPGPWRWYEYPAGRDEMPALVGPSFVEGERWWKKDAAKVCDFGDGTQYYPTQGTPPSEADRAFIAGAREDVPNLLAEVGRLRAENERLTAELGAQLTHDEEVARGARLFFGLPVREMIDRGWIMAESVDDPRVAPELARFFRVATISDVEAMLAGLTEKQETK